MKALCWSLSTLWCKWTANDNGCLTFLAFKIQKKKQTMDNRFCLPRLPCSARDCSNASSSRLLNKASESCEAPCILCVTDDKMIKNSMAVGKSHALVDIQSETKPTLALYLLPLLNTPLISVFCFFCFFFALPNLTRAGIKLNVASDADASDSCLRFGPRSMQGASAAAWDAVVDLSAASFGSSFEDFALEAAC